VFGKPGESDLSRESSGAIGGARQLEEREVRIGPSSREQREHILVQVKVQVERYQLRDGAWHLKSRESRVSGNVEDCQASWGELGDMGTGSLRSLASAIRLWSPPEQLLMQ